MVDGGEPRRVHEGDAVLASFSPNNRRIAFTRRISNPIQADICTIPVSGGAVVPVTNDRWTDWSPVWAPDGKFLYFASDRGGSMNLWRVPVDEVVGEGSRRARADHGTRCYPGAPEHLRGRQAHRVHLGARHGEHPAAAVRSGHMAADR